MILAIIGGGAAGLIAAIHAAYNCENKFKILILERMDRIGKKILATGNGRCNFTNINTDIKNYHGVNPSFVKYAIEKFSVDYTLNFFNNIGVFPKEEKDGKIYPYSDQASSILDALRNEVQRLNIEVKTNFEVKKIIPNKKGFKIISRSNEIIYSKKVIVTAGGCASPNLGSNGTGYNILKDVGHNITKISPALVQLKTSQKLVKGLQGIKFIGLASCFVDNAFFSQEYGEILFTDYGLSGPPIFQLSCISAVNKNVRIDIDFMPQYSMKDIFDILINRKEMLKHLTAEHFFTGLLNKKIGYVISKKAGIEKLSFPISNISKDIIWKMVYIIKSLQFDITENNGWNNAQVTAGGVFTNEIDSKTMQSKIVNGLYIAGEIVDIFGDCGGFNLQWAWSSGALAGFSAAEEMRK